MPRSECLLARVCVQLFWPTVESLVPSLLVSVVNPWLPCGLFCNLRSTRLRRELGPLLVLLSYRLQQRSLICLADLLTHAPHKEFAQRLVSLFATNPRQHLKTLE